jgi:hypothetical protein
MGVQLGMAGEFVLGMHGELEWDGVRLAGLWPKDQLLLAQKAGATMFGPVVNVNTGKSLAWNMARAIALIKPCMDVATIPVHPNAGMGVGGCRCSCIRPAMPSAGAPRPASISCASTACRWVRATLTGCTTPTRRQRVWAVSGPGEISWPVCR